MLISEMTNSHLCNSLNMLHKRTGVQASKFPQLEQEAIRRKLFWKDVTDSRYVGWDKDLTSYIGGKRR